MLFKSITAEPAYSGAVANKLKMFVGDSLPARAAGDWSALEPEGFIFRRERFG